VEKIEARGLEPLRLHGEGIISLAPIHLEANDFPQLEMGWGLHKAKTPTRFSAEQKTFMTDLFWKGETSR
jgi:hypothetical protein